MTVHMTNLRSLLLTDRAEPNTHDHFSEYTFSVESQLQSKRLRWLGHVFRMPTDRLPKKLLFGEVKGVCPPGCPRSSVYDALCECQSCCISRPFRHAQDRLLWTDKTCPVCT